MSGRSDNDNKENLQQQPISPRNKTPLVINGVTTERPKPTKFVLANDETEQPIIAASARIPLNENGSRRQVERGERQEERKQHYDTKYAVPAPMGTTTVGAASATSVIAAAPYMPEIPNYDRLTHEEQVSVRMEFGIKFGMLRRDWPNHGVPEINEKMTLSEIYVIYERFVRHITINNAMDNYRRIMIVIFLGLEVITTKFLNINASGFAESQIRSISRYEKMLFELGERNHSSRGSVWPSEFQIIFVVLTNMAFFLVFKLLTKFLDEDKANAILGVIKQFLIGGDAPAPQVAGPAPAPASATPSLAGPAVPAPPAAAPAAGFDFSSIMNIINNPQLAGMLSSLAGAFGRPAATPANATPSAPARPAYAE